MLMGSVDIPSVSMGPRVPEASDGQSQPCACLEAAVQPSTHVSSCRWNTIKEPPLLKGLPFHF